MKKVRLYVKNERIGAVWRPIFLLCTFALGELCVRAAGGGLWGPGLLLALLYAAAWACALGALCGLCAKRWNTVLLWLLAAGSFVLYGSQLIYYQVFGTYYTVFSLFNAEQAFGFMDAILQVICKNVGWLLVLLLPLVFLALLLHVRALSHGRLRRRQRLAQLLAAAAIGLAAFGALFLFGRAMNTPYDVWFHVRAADSTVEAVGVGEGMRLDAVRLLFGVSGAGGGPVDMSSAAVEDRSESNAQKQQDAQNAMPDGAKYGYNTDTSLDFAALAADSSGTLAGLDEYFSDAEPTAKNEMTGLFQGKNLILITAEGFYYPVIDKELTPTLYKLYSEGFHFDNFYTPLWGVSTSDGEYVACTGLIPKTGVWSMRRSGYNYMPYCLGNMFSALGYSANAYHDNEYTYYGRNISHPNMGYDYKGLNGGLDLTVTWPESDLEMIDVTTPEYVDNDHFDVYYMTVSGHLYYTFEGNEMSAKNREYVQDLDYSTHVKAYLACQIELDRALELLLERLDEAGQLENTVIALSADHYPYGLTNSEIDELVGHDVDTDFEIYKNAFLLYNAGTPSVTVTKPCSSLDILPTLLNLFGMDYDSRLLMGQDVFSDSEPLVIFSNHSWLTDKAQYNARTNALTITASGGRAEDYAQRISDEVEDKFSVSAKMLDNDYYAHVFGRDAA